MSTDRNIQSADNAEHFESPAERKAALRRQYRKLRGGLPEPLRLDAANRLGPALWNLVFWKQAPFTVAMTRSVGSEIPSSCAYDYLISRGVRVGIIPSNPSTNPDDFCWDGSAESLEHLKPPTEVDVVLVPGLAFTADGNRLGQGGGFFDRYLARCRPGCRFVGIGYSCQLAVTLPVEPHDVRMHHVVLV